MRKRYKIISVLFLSLFVVGQLSAETLKLATDPFHEDLLPSARISGSIVMGVQKGMQKTGVNTNLVEPSAYVPRSWANDTVCLRVVSASGFYESTNEYLVPTNWQGGVAIIPYPTKFSERLLGSEKFELGARLQRGPCASKRLETTFVSWNNAKDAKRELLINSFQSDAVFVYVDDNVQPVLCEPTSTDAKTAFDTVCKIDDPGNETMAEIQILRVIDGNAAPTTHLSVWFGSL